MTPTGRDDGRRQQRVLVSACLLGLDTRYDGGNCHRPGVVDELHGLCVVPVCPEQLGGLPTPRAPAEIAEGDGDDVLADEAAVMTREGRDVTDNYLRGARQARRLAERLGVAEARLKERSPSCGVTTIVRNGSPEPGRGVTAALLSQGGLEVKGIE